MKKWTGRMAAAVAAILSGIAAVVLPLSATTASAAPSVPFNDPSATGAIGFCSQDNKPVTSGSLLTEPFVSKAISTVPAPAGYTEAWLVLVQPVQHEDPSLWTPYELTGDAKFSNPRHPAAQSITIDPPLLEPYNSLPPYWDGYYQLRMYFAAPGKPPVTTPYPAAVIQVKGKKWSLVSGGNVDCAGSSAVSKLSSELPKSVVDTPQTIVVGGKKVASPTTTGKKGNTTSTIPTSGSGSATTPPSTGASTVPGTRPATSTPPTRSSSVAAAADVRASGGGSSAWWIALVVALVVVAGSAVSLRLRRSRRSA